MPCSGVGSVADAATIETAGDSDPEDFEHVAASRFEAAASFAHPAPWLDGESSLPSSVSCSQSTSCSRHLVVQ